MATKPHICTQEEIAYIKRNYKGDRKSAELIAKQLNIRFNTIKWQLQKLGICFRPVKNKFWTDKKKDQLRELSGRYCVETVARKMNVSPNAVMIMRQIVGIHQINRDGWYTLNDVCQVCGVGHTVVERWICNNILKATKYTDNNKPRSVWQIEEEDFRDFIITYTQELVGRNIDILQIIQIVNRHSRTNGIKRFNNRKEIL